MSQRVRNRAVPSIIRFSKSFGYLTKPLCGRRFKILISLALVSVVSHHTTSIQDKRDLSSRKFYPTFDVFTYPPVVVKQPADANEHYSASQHGDVLSP